MTMRVSFTSDHPTQAPVTPVQTATRQAPVRTLPVARMLVVLMAIVVVGAAVFFWWTGTRVHSFGVVTTGIEVFHAPVRSRIVSVHAEPGDRVSADSVLYVLVSEDAQAELKEAQESLAQEKRVLEVGMSQQDTLFDDPIQELRDLAAARARLQQLESRAPGVELLRREAAVQRERDLERAARAVDFQRQLLTARSARQQRVEDLRTRAAASVDEATLAGEETLRARFELENAEAEHARLLAANASAEQMSEREVEADADSLVIAREYVGNLEKSYRLAKVLLVKEKERGIENIRSRITSLEARITHLKNFAGPTEVRALADGVVTEVVVSEGSNVPKDGMIMGVAGTGKVWISAFVPPNRAKEVAIGDEVTVYPTTETGSLRGRVTAGGGIQYKVHPALQGRIGDASAVYVRIDLDEAKANLIPGNVVKVVIR